VNNSEAHYSCIVIGAGISGLMAATILRKYGKRTVVLDKGRGVGGRMATRRTEGFCFDHGAQAVFCRSEEFERTVLDWLQQGVAKHCSYPLEADCEHMRVGPVCGLGGMSFLAKALASDLNVITAARVQTVRWSGFRWEVVTETGGKFYSDSVIMTAPVPQSLELLKAGELDFPPVVASRLADVMYERCIALMAVFDSPAPILRPPFIKFQGGVVNLLVDNFAKGVSSQPGAFTIHGSADFSEAFWEKAESEIVSALLEATADCLPRSASLSQVHRWRYSRAIAVYDNAFQLLEDPGLLALAGDGFLGGDIEGAALSGMRAAEAIAARITRRGV
jgi:renalase